MAHLILALEPDPQLRRHFLARAKQTLAAETNLQVHSAELGVLAAVWGVSQQTPVSLSCNEDEFSLLLGYALTENHATITAERLLQDKRERSWGGQACNGYFATVRYSQAAGLAVDIDPLGFFPMFFTEPSQPLLIGTSAAMFESHPRFQTVLNPVGLTGVLLANGLINNRSLIKNVRQQAAGHQLRVSPAGQITETETCHISVSPENEGRSYGETLSFVEREFKNVIDRHRPKNCSSTLLLSEGLDSRLMAGYLKDLSVEFTATTLGKPTDFEVRAARRVAKCLDIPLILKDTDCSRDELIDITRHVARWEHLTRGFSGIQSVNASFGEMAPRFWSGHFLDDILGGYASRYSLDPKTGQLSFDTFFRKLNRWGIAPETLQQLMRPAFTDSRAVVNGLVEELRAQWNRYDGTNAQKSFRLKLATRCRYHLAGALYRFAHVSWPVAPYLDQQLLSSLLQVPIDAMLGRKLETDLLKMQSKGLAKVPLDTNSFRFENASTLQATAAFDPRKLWGSARKSARSWYWRHYHRQEPRRYQRVFHPDQPAWKTIREAAETNRHGLLDWMDRDHLARLVPPPQENLPLADPFAGGAALRTLCGLMLWDKERQSQRRAAA